LADIWPAKEINLVANSDGRPVSAAVNYWPDPQGLEPLLAIERGQFQAIGRDKLTFYAQKLNNATLIVLLLRV
jgi:hypothetical protein